MLAIPDRLKCQLVGPKDRSGDLSVLRPRHWPTNQLLRRFQYTFDALLHLN